MVSVCPRPRGKNRDNGKLPDFQNFRVFFISFLIITQKIFKIEFRDLFHIVDIFILYKMKKKFISISLIFIEISTVFFIENGKFSDFSLKKIHNILNFYSR